MAIRLSGPRALTLAAAGLLVLLGGCATAPTPAEKPVRLVWPPPPLTARIEFVRSIVSEENLEKDTTFSERLVTFLGGERPAPNRIAEPAGLAVSDDGQRLYVADFGQLAVFVFDFARHSFVKIGGAEPLGRPVGLALDAEENLYVVEQEKRAVSVFDRTGHRLRSITHASVERPTGIAIDRTRGRIYLVDTAHTLSTEHTVKVFDMTGELVGKIGRGKGEEEDQLLFPTYAAVDAAGHLYVSDTLNSRVQVFDPAGKRVRSFGQRGTSWGSFDKPKGVALDGFGNVYVTDSGWSNVQIFNQNGQVLLFFGGRGPIPGMLKNPSALAIDRSNRIYVADYLNHRVEVYQLVNTKAEDSYLDARTGPKGGDTTQATQPARPSTQ